MDLCRLTGYMPTWLGGDLEQLRDPATNVKIAYALSKGGADWTPWVAYNNGKYLAYMR